jgi:hypothetical protein
MIRADLVEVLGLQAAGGQRRRARRAARGDHRRARVERHRVAVDRDADVVQAVLAIWPSSSESRRSTSTRCTSVPPVSTLTPLPRRSSSADACAPATVRSWRSRNARCRDPQRDRLAGDDVLERAALLAGNTAELIFLRTPRGRGSCRRARRRASCGRGGDDVGVRAPGWGAARGDEAGEVRHVDHQQRADLVGDLAEALEVEDAG